MEHKLIKCPGCSKDVSLLAISCPQCGYPIEAHRRGKLKNIDKIEREGNSNLGLIIIVIVLSFLSIFIFPLPLLILNILISIIIIFKNNLSEGISLLILALITGGIGIVGGIAIWNLLEKNI